MIARYSDCRHLVSNPSANSLLTMPGWLRTPKPPAAPSLHVAPAAPVQQVFHCNGVNPVSVLKMLPLESLLQEHWEAWCAGHGGGGPVQLWHLCVNAFCTIHSGAVDVRVNNSAIKEVFSKKDCLLHKAPRMSRETDEIASAFRKQHFSCGVCMALEKVFCLAMRTIATVCKAKMVIHYFSTCDVRHLEFLTPVKHLSAKGHKMLIAEELTSFQALVKAREDFLTFKSQNGAIIGQDVCKNSRVFLKRCFHAITTNAHGIADKAIKAGFSSWLNMISLQSRGKDMRALRYEPAWKNYALSEYLLKPAAFGHFRANLAEGAAPCARNLRKTAARMQVGIESSLMNEEEEAVAARVRIVGQVLKERGVSAVTVLADELALVAAMRFCGKYGVCIGAAGKHKLLDYKDVEAGRAQIPLSSLARKAKCVGILPQSNDPIYIVLIRPGDADATEETDFNKRHHAVFRRVLQSELNIDIVSWYFDGISKEQEWLFSMLVSHMRTTEKDRMKATAGGADMRHSVKALRNAMIFGGSVCPHGGFLIVNSTIFAHLGVEVSNIQVKDVFSDWRVERLCRALPLFDELHDKGVPMSEIIGTGIYTHSILLTICALSSPDPSLTRKARILSLLFRIKQSE